MSLGPHTIIQSVSAGNQFDGTEPATTAVTTKRVKTYPEDDAGGLFEFDQLTGNRIGEVQRVALRLDLGAGDSWTLSVVHADDSETLWVAGDDDTDVVITDKLQLTAGEALKLVTTGGAAAMRADVTLLLVGGGTA